MKHLLTMLLFLTISFASFSQKKVSVGINAGAAVPMGLFGDAVSTGFGGNASGEYPVSSHIDLTLSAGYLTWSFDFSSTGLPASQLPEATISAIPIMAGMKYYFIEGSFKPYAALNLGMHMVTAKSTLNGQSTDSTQTKSGWAVGAGFLASLSENIDLDVSAKLNGNGAEVVKGDKSSGNYESETITFFGILAGIRFRF